MNSLTFSLIYLSIGLIIVALVWIITTPISRLFSKTLPITRLLQISINLAHVLSGILFPLPLPLDIPIRSLGLTIFTIGVCIAIWAKIVMKDSWGYPGMHLIDKQKILITTGPFEFTRNPIYLGIIIASLGMAVALKSAFIFLVFILYIVFQNSIKEEEKQLTKHFGKKYLDYCDKVPRFI